MTEATAWTWAQSFENAEAGMTVWITAGEYGDLTLILDTKHGTPTSPIKFIGYKNTINDIRTNYLEGATSLETRNNLSDKFSSAEMPTLTGKELATRTEDDIAIMLKDVSHAVFRNIQMRQYAQGLQNRQGNSFHVSHIIVDRINGYDFIQRSHDTEEA